MDRQQEFVLRTLEERDIRFVRLWFTDVLGTLKSVSVAPAELEAAFEEGIGFDGSAIEGFARVFESDMVAMPDPTTFQVFPFEGGVSGESARMFCDILLPDGAPSWADPRHVLRRALSKAAEKGFTFYTHPEIEFFLLENGPQDGSVPIPVDTGGYFEHTTHAVARDFRRQAVLALERIGISVEFSHHEVAPGQQEIDLRYADALTTADNIMTFRHVVKEVALSTGVQATLHAEAVHRPAGQRHAHPPVAVRGRAQRVPRRRRPDEAVQGRRKSFIAGLLVHAREYTAVTNQWVNSYKRLFPQALPDRITEIAGVRLLGPPQPVRAGPGARVRQAELGPGRGPLARLGDQPLPGLRGAARRRPEGHRGGLRAAAGRRGRRLVAVQRRAPAMGYEALPENLSEAIDVMAGSELVAEVLGEHVFDFFLRNKRAEWEQYRREVTPYERQRYLAL